MRICLSGQRSNGQGRPLRGDPKTRGALRLLGLGKMGRAPKDSLSSSKYLFPHLSNPTNVGLLESLFIFARAFHELKPSWVAPRKRAAAALTPCRPLSRPDIVVRCKCLLSPLLAPQAAPPLAQAGVATYRTGTQTY